jgi:ribosomal-protein-alanine N-acetyltransferase
VPLVPAGRADVYAGFFRGDGRGPARIMTAPRVLALSGLLEAIAEARRAAGLGTVRCIGPGAARWQEALEESFPHATSGDWRFDGLAAADLLAAARASWGPASGLPAPGAETRPLYVRSAQAEERVRHLVNAALPLALRAMETRDVPAVAAVEREVFTDPWPESFFLGELAQPLMFARVAEREGRLVGYSVAWLGAGTAAGAGSGHLGNLAVTPGERRRGVARALLADLLAASVARGVGSLTLEVRATNDAAQALYRAHGFRLVGVRRGYYRDTGEDAMVMEWRAEAR